MQLGRPRAWAGRESERGTDLFSNCNCFSLFCWGGRWLDSVGPNFHQWSPIAAQNLEMMGGTRHLGWLLRPEVTLFRNCVVSQHYA